MNMKKISNYLSKILLLTVIFGSSLSLATPNPTDATTTTIKFATEATYPPIVSLSMTGEMGGFETALVNSICQEANLNCEFHHRPFDSLFPSLAFKKIDVVYGGIGITEARKDQVLFSKVLYTMPVGFIFKETKEIFEEKTIGFQQGATGFEQYLKKHYPNAKLKTYASLQDALLDFNNQRIQAVFGDLPVMKYWLKNTGKENSNYQFLELKKEQVLEFSNGNAFAAHKENTALIEKINMAFDKLVDNGTFEKLKQLHWN